MALTKRRPRSATVTADGPLEMYAISGWNFDQLLASDAGIRQAVEHAIAEHVDADEVRGGV
jgi:CRP-like cAMP-binding protein